MSVGPKGLREQLEVNFGSWLQGCQFPMGAGQDREQFMSWWPGNGGKGTKRRQKERPVTGGFMKDSLREVAMGDRPA